MDYPSTPTLKRKSSNKKIIISSPSSELLHFLTIPNPSAIEDPRERLQIMTPKHQIRSISSSLEKSPKTILLQKRPTGLNRVNLMKKKGPIVNWNKKNMDLRSSNKLSLSQNYKK